MGLAFPDTWRLATVLNCSIRTPVLAAATILLVAFSTCNLTWLHTIGFDVWNLPQLEREVRDSEAANEELAALNSDIQARIATKEALVAELIEGRSSLAKVTDEFAAMNQAQPGYMDVIRVTFLGRNDREKVARTVIAYVSSRIQDRDESARTVERLEAELAEMN